MSIPPAAVSGAGEAYPGALAPGPGWVHRARYPVTRADTVPEMVRHVAAPTALQHGEPVLATAMLVAFLEDACWQLLETADAVPAGHARLGLAFDGFRHRSPARVGDEIEVEIRCLRHDHTRGVAVFRVQALNLRTGQQVIEPLRHELRIVNRRLWRERFGISEHERDPNTESSTASPADCGSPDRGAARSLNTNSDAGEA